MQFIFLWFKRIIFINEVVVLVWRKALKAAKAKGKRTDLKTEVTRKQNMPNVPKNEYFLPPDTHTQTSISRFVILL